MDTQKALSAAAALCSKKEYCCQDIRKKLEKWGIEEKDRQSILNELIRNKFLDDNRFALFYVRDKFRFNKWGKTKIAQMLKQKGIAPAIIQEALATLPSEEQEEVCLRLMKQKCKHIRETDPLKTKAKLLRFALGRGFDYDTVNRCLLRLLQAEQEEE